LWVHGIENETRKKREKKEGKKKKKKGGRSDALGSIHKTILPVPSREVDRKEKEERKKEEKASPSLREKKKKQMFIGKDPRRLDRQGGFLAREGTDGERTGRGGRRKKRKKKRKRMTMGKEEGRGRGGKRKRFPTFTLPRTVINKGGKREKRREALLPVSLTIHSRRHSRA